jgi:hypothetical protein
MSSQQLTQWANELRDGLDFSVRLRMVLAAGMLSALYLKLLVARVAPGVKGLLLTMPVLLLNMWMPLLFNKSAEILSMVTMLLSLTWLASFKVT